MFHDSLNLILKNKERVDSGYLNCIPNPFPRMSEKFPGIEKGKYYIITANAKAGKSQITDYFFIHHPIKYILENNTNLDVEVLYFSLEVSAQLKALQAISHFLYVFFGIVRSPKELRSIKRALDSDVIDRIKDLEPFMDRYFQKVTYIENIRNRYGIWKYLFNYAERNGTIAYREMMIDGNKQNIISSYTPHNSEKIVIPIVDHVSLLLPEKGDSLHDAIGKLSSQDFINARNIFSMSPVLVQQQAASQESIENKKADALAPSLAGLADNKTTQRDPEYVFGLFSPARHHIPKYYGYDITALGDTFRSLEILASREDGGLGITPLLFNGACSYFEELPLPNLMKY